jgi:hypothetical protein
VGGRWGIDIISDTQTSPTLPPIFRGRSFPHFLGQNWGKNWIFTPVCPCSLLRRDLVQAPPASPPLSPSPIFFFIQHGRSQSSSTPPPPPAAPPVLPLLPSDGQIVLATSNNVALCIMQGLMRTRSHISPNGKWSVLEELLWEPEPHTPGPFHATFQQWAEKMHARNMKDSVLSILGVHGVFDPVVVTNPSRYQSLAKHANEEMDSSEAACRAAINAEHILQEACQCENVHQEGTLGRHQ